MPTTRERATLRIWPREAGPGTAAAVTEALGVAPTNSHEAGERRSERDDRPWVKGMWSLDSDLPWDQPLSDHVDQLCAAVEGSREALTRLGHEGYSMDCFCFVEVEGGNGGVLLKASTLQRLADLSVELDLDIYPSGDEADFVASQRTR